MTSNFAALAAHLPDVAELGRKAEQSFHGDPLASMARLRQLGERLAREVLLHHRLGDWDQSQFDRLRRLSTQADTEREAIEAFHVLRREGNKAVHADGRAGHSEAMQMLRAAHRLVRWYWSNYTDQAPPKPGPFVKPSGRGDREAQQELQERLEAERLEREAALEELERLHRLVLMPQVATHQQVEACFKKLDEARKERVEAFLRGFRIEPLSSDWPLRTPAGMADDKVRFVSVDDLVVVVIQPSRSDLLLVVYVGEEPEATAWARDRRFEVNPSIGTLQIYHVAEASAAVEGARGGLFEALSDAELLGLGVPVPLLPAVRSVGDDADLDALVVHLPPEAGDGLYMVASGYSAEELHRELSRRAMPEPVDADDFAVAVHHPDSQRSFRLLDSDADLEEVLSGSVEAWRVYLHPDQRKLVRMKANGPVRVLGGAGTGKTVALLHRAAHLVSEVFTAPEERLLVTTFTRNLAAELRHHLAKLVEPEALERVEVTNLHAVVAALWEAHGDGRRLARPTEIDRCWAEAAAADALDLPERFYRDEWEQVILAQALDGELAYLRAPRRGRSHPLSRKDRRRVWQVLAAYRHGLDERGLCEYADQMHLLTLGLEEGRVPRPYVAALADEVQDFDAPALRFLRALIPAGPGDLFLVGDSHQRIYGSPVQMGRCGIEIRGRSRRLRVNYRTTARVRRWAVAVLEGERFDDLDGGDDNLHGYRSLREGVDPTVRLLRTASEERQVVTELLRGWLDELPAEALCVAAATHREVEDLRAHFEAAGIPTQVVQTESVAEGEGVRLATFHRLKGLEFPRLVLTGVQQGRMPLRNAHWHDLDDDGKALWDRRQRCLLYVAATRARDQLVVTGHGQPSPFVAG